MKKLSRILEWALVAMMGAVAVLLAALPWSITWVTERTRDDPYYIKYLIILGYSGVMALLILWQGRGFMHNVNHGRIFSADTVRRFNILAGELFVLAGFYLCTMFWMSKFFMAALFVVFVVLGCTMLVMAQVFRQAVAYKEENELTI